MLAAFWCFVSLLAISRLEKRLPSEMQEQLEFHTSFSGLWPKAQGAAAGSTPSSMPIPPPATSTPLISLGI